MTTSPDGQRICVSSRLAEICRRYGAGHNLTRAVTCLGTTYPRRHRPRRCLLGPSHSTARLSGSTRQKAADRATTTSRRRPRPKTAQNRRFRTHGGPVCQEGVLI